MNGNAVKIVSGLAIAGILAAVGVYAQQMVNCEKIKNLETRMSAMEVRQSHELREQRVMFNKLLDRVLPNAD